MAYFLGESARPVIEKKKIRVRVSKELDLGKMGGGEVEYYIEIAYIYHATIGKIIIPTGKDAWANEKPGDMPFPEHVVRKALERWLNSSDGKEAIVEAIKEN
jgi:hypothetical protein